MTARCAVAASFLLILPFLASGQALQRGDVTIGVSAGYGFQSAVLSRGPMIGAEATLSITDRFYLRGSGGRMSSTLDRSPFSASQTNQFAGAAFGTQFRLQQSLSPFVEGGFVGLWGTGIQVFSPTGRDVDRRLNDLEFWQVAVEAGGGIRYVRTPKSRWGLGLFYRLSFPIRRQDSQASSLILLKTTGPHDRAGISVFFRF